MDRFTQSVVDPIQSRDLDRGRLDFHAHAPVGGFNNYLMGTWKRDQWDAVKPSIDTAILEHCYLLGLTDPNRSNIAGFGSKIDCKNSRLATGLIACPLL